MKKQQINFNVTPRGMILYTPDKKDVCIAHALDESSYSISSIPYLLWKFQEIHNSYDFLMTEKQALFSILRLMVEILIASLLPNILKNYFALSFRHALGIFCLLYGFAFLFEFSICNNLRMKKTEKGKQLLRCSGALNMVLNAYEKSGNIPTLKEAQKASIYRINKGIFLSSSKKMGIFSFVISFTFFLPLLVQLLFIPIWIVVLVQAFKTSLFGLLQIPYVAKPTEYELKMACDLVKFWHGLVHEEF